MAILRNIRRRFTLPNHSERSSAQETCRNASPRRHSAPASVSRSIFRKLRRIPSHPKGPIPWSITEICYQYMVDTYHCADQTPMSAKFDQPPLRDFIEKVLHASGASHIAVASAIVLLDRFRSELPESLDGLQFSGHLLFISAFMLAVQQMACNRGGGEKVFDHEFWSRASGYPPINIARLRDQIYDKLDGNVFVAPESEPILRLLLPALPD
ncbi:hypothetical protein BDZ97DRAFT_1862936 [Flammula alnicola]|nr:hypothetical protein BDZ97DRAFT_1862936 [Flammula alnicola]